MGMIISENFFRDHNLPTTTTDQPITVHFAGHANLIPHCPEDLYINIPKEVKIKQRPLACISETECLTLKEYLSDMNNSGKIRVSNRLFGASVLFTKKKDRGLRLLGPQCRNSRDQTPSVSYTDLWERARGK
ncbi:hypothetical protein HK096_007306, partial [Nowakowskiella sp. JEL0078]